MQQERLGSKEAVLRQVAATAFRIRTAISVWKNPAALRILCGDTMKPGNPGVCNTLNGALLAFRSFDSNDLMGTSWTKFPLSEVHSFATPVEKHFQAAVANDCQLRHARIHGWTLTGQVKEVCISTI